MSTPSKSRLKWRAVTSLGLLVLYFITLIVFSAGQGAIEGSIALGQLNGGDAEYAAARAAITSHTIPSISGWIFFGSILFIWGSFLLKRKRNDSTGKDS